MLRVVLITSTLLGSWLGMQAIHEAGHVIGAWLTGGRVERVVLHPLTISRTDLSHNPRPLAVVWAGPIVGVAVPLAAWMLVAYLAMPGAFVVRFFTGFCLLVNGLYIGVGSFARIGDCGDMLRHGSPMSCLWVFGMVMAPIGLWLWNGQGRHFGLGPKPDKVAPVVAWATGAVFVVLLVFGLAVGGE